MAEQDEQGTEEQETEGQEGQQEEQEQQEVEGQGGKGGQEGQADDEGGEDEEPSGKAKTAEQLRAELRKSDRVRKRESAKAKKENDDLRAQLKKLTDANASEAEKAIDAAREEGRTTALAEVQRELRAERLAGAVTRLAGKGLTVGEGDEKETIKFADRPTRVMLEQALANEDIDSADIFDDKGKVRDDGLREAVAQLIADEENLIVRPPSNGGEQKKPPVNDAGKGASGGSKSLEEMTPDEHLKEIQRR